MLPPPASWVEIAVVTFVALGVLFKNLPWVLAQLLTAVRAVAAFGPSVKIAWRHGRAVAVVDPAPGGQAPAPRLDRRCGHDRRPGQDRRRCSIGPPSGIERRSGVDRRSGPERRAGPGLAAG